VTQARSRRSRTSTTASEPDGNPDFQQSIHSSNSETASDGCNYFNHETESPGTALKDRSKAILWNPDSNTAENRGLLSQ
jgi:hypothetical protein